MSVTLTDREIEYLGVDMHKLNELRRARKLCTERVYVFVANHHEAHRIARTSNIVVASLSKYKDLGKKRLILLDKGTLVCTFDQPLTPHPDDDKYLARPDVPRFQPRYEGKDTQDRMFMLLCSVVQAEQIAEEHPVRICTMGEYQSMGGKSAMSRLPKHTVKGPMCGYNPVTQYS